MKLSRREVTCKARPIGRVAFEPQQLTSFSGLLLVQHVFAALGVRRRLDRCFAGADQGAYPAARLFLLLMVHLLLGFRRLRSLEHYGQDPMVLDLVGLKRAPSVSTWAERLSQLSPHVPERLRLQQRAFVLEGLKPQKLQRLTLDFDGSVFNSRRHAEGIAVGYNPRRKGQRSYYPLFCSLAQTGQVLDVLHRSGNVHDYNGAVPFMRDCIAAVREQHPRKRLEMRMDTAFFSEELIDEFGDHLDFTIGVAFTRFPDLKALVEQRQDWQPLDGEDQWSYFEIKQWRPARWKRPPVRLILLRRKQADQVKGPLQLDLFEPVSYQYQYSVIATNMSGAVHEVMSFHHGRSSQEGIFGELKEQLSMDYVPFRKRVGNEIYMWAAIWTHNIFRAMHMRETPKASRSNAKRATRWAFIQIRTFRETYLLRPGRITKPANRKLLTFALPGNKQDQFESRLEFWGNEAQATG